MQLIGYIKIQNSTIKKKNQTVLGWKPGNALSSHLPPPGSSASASADP
jgi:hypothetical protein